ncbi:SDR family oxidoreductase [Prochlorococcus sp. MIT 1341]|uniref:SDR family oxidoreductase n=1 Tax=Prochlorococcus sp. MIT 1341 TaxID=3096221 RepID=UPI002A74B430|nr:SDR family oxidoreductase [Prochlorococcus sp. MIT 1341]
MLFSSGLKSKLTGKRIGITGAKGTLGKALTKSLKEKEAVIIGITHGEIPKIDVLADSPQEWVKWECGKESSLESTLAGLDILILNHGINHHSNLTPSDLTEALEVNALSSWRLMKLFQSISEKESNNSAQREIWVNTSEAEIQPALSPAYELSKRLIGQLVTLNWINLSKKQRKKYRIRKLVLGPFKSELNPIGLMSPSWVANQIINQADLGLDLIIITPNPITYFLMPITELSRIFYAKIMQSTQISHS